jgi:glycosyltransferase involved in cell wall biosynthesis
MAQQKGMKVVLEDLLTAAGSRSRAKLRLQKSVLQILRYSLPSNTFASFGWESYRRADACLANTSWEAHLMHYLYRASPERVHVLPNGVEDVFLQSAPVQRGPWLVCTATITTRKRVLELAQAAVEAQTPLWVVGKPYAPEDPYADQFFELAKSHPTVLRYEGAIADRAELARVYRAARGFVLFSTMETRSLASEEAAACACPLFLSDLPWARSVFGGNACYCPIASPQRTASFLRKFYDEAPGLKPPPKPLSWVDVAKQLKGIYEVIVGANT